MGKQVNIGHGEHSASPANSSGYGFDIDGNPTITNSAGVDTPLQISSNNPANIIANKGVGLAADLPTFGFSQGDVYVTNDTFVIYTAADSGSWGLVDLVRGQLVTDVLDTQELPPVYQFYNDILMPIANYVTNELGGLPE